MVSFKHLENKAKNLHIHFILFYGRPCMRKITNIKDRQKETTTKEGFNQKPKLKTKWI